MLRPGGTFLFALALFAAGAWPPVASLLHAQTLEPVLEGNQLTVTYSRDNGTNIAVERSADLVSWQLADSRETLLASDAQTQTIKSSVAIDEPVGMFIRLQASQGWAIRLAWDPVSNDDIAGYRLYYFKTGELTTLRRMDVGNQTTTTVSLPEDGGVYSFFVTCYDVEGLESGPSSKLDVGHFWN